MKGATLISAVLLADGLAGGAAWLWVGNGGADRPAHRVAASDNRFDRPARRRHMSYADVPAIITSTRHTCAAEDTFLVSTVAETATVDHAAAAPATQPTTMPASPLPGSAVASVEDGFVGGGLGEAGTGGGAMPERIEVAMLDPNRRFGPTTRPELPEAQHPPLSDDKNVDTGKPPHEWQRATDDWFGARPWLDDRGITFQASVAMEYAKNLRGGVSTNGSDFRHLFNANLTLDTDKLVGLPGGTLFVSFQNQGGDGAADSGAAQNVSNLDADGRTQVSEVWYEQVLFGGTVRVKAGKVDANTEFASAKNAGEFLNSSMGYSPTILGIPTYPDPAFGLNVFVNPTDHLYAGVGVYDGAAQEGVPTGSHGPATLFGDPGDLFFIAEGGLKWSLAGGRDGRAGFGGWHHTGTFDRFDGGTESGTSGAYFVADQTVWRENPDVESDAQGVGVYVQYGYADPSVSLFHHHVGAGFSWKGAVPGRDDDVFGVGLSYVRFAGGAGLDHDGELATEAFYKFQLTPWVSVKPDLQYIHNPAAGRSDALVATVRAVVDF